MNIAQDKVVALSYTLKVNDEIIETVTAEKPMKFIFGTGYLLPKFEEYINGKTTGDTFEFTLSAEEAYGEINNDAIVELPKNLFEVEGKIEDGLLTVGNVLPMMDSQGNRLNGEIKEVKDSSIIMDFNHPLAGEELNFSGSVVEVREATAEELANGLYGEKAAAQGCSGDCCSGCSGCH